eukprot:353220-Chlamydomonas_euryale.AAC.1
MAAGLQFLHRQHRRKKEKRGVVHPRQGEKEEEQRVRGVHTLFTGSAGVRGLAHFTDRDVLKRKRRRKGDRTLHRQRLHTAGDQRGEHDFATGTAVAKHVRLRTGHFSCAPSPPTFSSARSSCPKSRTPLSFFLLHPLFKVGMPTLCPSPQLLSPPFARTT